MTVPIDAAYTFTKAEVRKDNINEGLFVGDKLAHIPDHTFSLRAGIETTMSWDNYISIKYIDETCNAIGCAGTFKGTGAFVSADLLSHYPLNDSVTVFLKVENVLDKRAIVSRSPDGARPNKGRIASVGFSLDF
jgi:Fe(3+) dicitrate transport protein